MITPYFAEHVATIVAEQYADGLTAALVRRRVLIERTYPHWWQGWAGFDRFRNPTTSRTLTVLVGLPMPAPFRREGSCLVFDPIVLLSNSQANDVCLMDSEGNVIADRFTNLLAISEGDTVSIDSLRNGADDVTIDGRSAAWIAAYHRITRASEIFLHTRVLSQGPGEEDGVFHQALLDDDRRQREGLLAEAALFVQLAQCDPTVGVMVGPWVDEYHDQREADRRASMEDIGKFFERETEKP